MREYALSHPEYSTCWPNLVLETVRLIGICLLIELFMASLKIRFVHVSVMYMFLSASVKGLVQSQIHFSKVLYILGMQKCKNTRSFMCMFSFNQYTTQKKRWAKHWKQLISSTCYLSRSPFMMPCQERHTWVEVVLTLIHIIIWLKK